MAMMYELEYGEEWVNLDRIDRVKVFSRKNERGDQIHTTCFYRDGERVAERVSYGVAPSLTEQTAQIIPSTFGQEVFFLDTNNWDEQARQWRRPDTVIVRRYTVVAWRIAEGDEGDESYAVPVVAAHNVSGKRLVQMPDGRLYEPSYEGDSYDNLEDAKRAVLERAQQDFDVSAKPQAEKTEAA